MSTATPAATATVAVSMPLSRAATTGVARRVGTSSVAVSRTRTRRQCLTKGSTEASVPSRTTTADALAGPQHGDQRRCCHEREPEPRDRLREAADGDPADGDDEQRFHRASPIRWPPWTPHRRPPSGEVLHVKWADLWDGAALARPHAPGRAAAQGRQGAILIPVGPSAPVPWERIVGKGATA